ncbi:hypothetical protein K505DRAFT_250696 [Melanomma pulvis-pyrius CBS 109.77]|uniref:F-box domain-containing protein n=1 Tax=Melanomma pulvis-pyrius CBS 109.77 TaxID=1314802 RepID=A0A6A6X2T0_9PLEO|nr:hypothetical protein K505DRAFT_250696 [Melanomma pulvis-pyrius CBS 109.77]
MSQQQTPQEPATSARYSKRKRVQINYYEGASDTDDAVDSRFEDSENESQDLKQKPAHSSKPLPKRKIFPFLKLPAEIRNVIYGYCLADPRGVYLFSTTKDRRRTVRRASTYYMEHIYHRQLYGLRQHDDRQQPEHWWRFILDNTTEDSELKDFLMRWVSLAPSLLATNKQISAEGRDILYGNEFKMDDTMALHSFMVDIGPRMASLLTRVTLRAWDMGRGVHKAYNHACFCMLTSATNIQKFTIEGPVSLRYNPKGIACQLYRDGFPWLEAVGIAKGKVDAAVDLIHLTQSTLSRGRRNYRLDDFEKDHKEFSDELSRLLVNSENKRKMRAQPQAVAVKKSKKAAPKEIWD